jgi:hypothetical protein
MWFRKIVGRREVLSKTIEKETTRVLLFSKMRHTLLLVV